MDSRYQNNTLKSLIFLGFLLLNGCATIGQLVVPLESIDKPKGPYGIGTQVFFGQMKKGANNIQQTQRTLESYRYKFGILRKLRKVIKKQHIWCFPIKL